MIWAPRASRRSRPQSLELLRQILNISPDTKIIAMTEHDARELAVSAVGLGATDFYHKPLDAGVLSIVVRRALRIRELEEENWRLRERTGSMALEGIIGVSDCHAQPVPRHREGRAHQRHRAAARGQRHRQGAAGARLHRLSGRAHKPFVAINCAAIPDTLLESELFGYEKGAFTGAAKRTAGKLESADGGTVFLDEIGEMPASLQAKLLRVVQERTVERIGGRVPLALDLRIVCATNRNLDALHRHAAAFRDDLFYRISEVTIRIPPLRDRQGDSLLLAQFLLQQIAERFGKPTRGLAPGCHPRHPGLPLAGQRARAGEPHQGRGHHGRGRGGDRGGPGAGGSGRRSGVPEPARRAPARRGAGGAPVARRGRAATCRAPRNCSGVTRPTLYDLLGKHSIDAAQFGKNVPLAADSAAPVAALPNAEPRGGPA